MNLMIIQQKLFDLNNEEKKKWEENAQYLWDQWDKTKRSNIHVTGYLEEE